MSQTTGKKVSGNLKEGNEGEWTMKASNVTVQQISCQPLGSELNKFPMIGKIAGTVSNPWNFLIMAVVMLCSAMVTPVRAGDLYPPAADAPPELRLALNLAMGRDQTAYHFAETVDGLATVMEPEG